MSLSPIRTFMRSSSCHVVTQNAVRNVEGTELRILYLFDVILTVHRR